MKPDYVTFVDDFLMLQEKHQQLQMLESTSILHPPFPALFRKGSD
jgi:hypothetical protein